MGKLGVLSVILLSSVVLASSTIPDFLKDVEWSGEKHLASYEWVQGGYINTVSAAQLRSYEFYVHIGVGILEGAGRRYYAPGAGDYAVFFLRKGKKAPVVKVVRTLKYSMKDSGSQSSFSNELDWDGRVDVIMKDDQQRVQIRPWDSVQLIERHRTNLLEAVREWSQGNRKEKLAAQVLGHVLAFDWEREAFTVEFVVRNPR